MNSIHYLYAAYIATWIIHGTYLAILVRKYARIRREMESLRKKPSV
jgi:CcmD family protein